MYIVCVTVMLTVLQALTGMWSKARLVIECCFMCEGDHCTVAGLHGGSSHHQRRREALRDKR